MESLRFVLAILLLLCAGYVVAMNWGCVIASSHNKRRGIDKHYSMVPIISLIFVSLAVVAYPYSPKWWMWLIAAGDISNLLMVLWPFFLLKDRFASFRTNG